MVALAYEATGDLPRAQARLATIKDSDSRKVLGEQAQRMLAGNSPMQAVQVLADLSEALQSQATAAPPSALNPESPSPTSQIAETSASSNNDVVSTPVEATAILTATLEPGAVLTLEDTPNSVTIPIVTLVPRPRPSSTPTPGLPFELITQASQCEPGQPGLLQIYLIDSRGNPATGVELVITWFNGEEHFFTGLKPEINSGYADYTMTENVEYALSLSAGGTRVTNLSAPPCIDASGAAYPGSIRLDFKQP